MADENVLNVGCEFGFVAGASNRTFAGPAVQTSGVCSRATVSTIEGWSSASLRARAFGSLLIGALEFGVRGKSRVPVLEGRSGPCSRATCAATAGRFSACEVCWPLQSRPPASAPVPPTRQSKAGFLHVCR